MKLYHGTGERAAKLALVEGIKPRGEHGNSNWKRTIESNPNGVYLTDAYPLYFAFNAVKDGERAAVLEIDTDRLQEFFLVPDEDVLEQAGRRVDGISGSMKQRTRYYRSQQKLHIASDTWKKSLEAMGTCTYLGTIPPEAITRVVYVDPKLAPTLVLSATDAMIILANYRFCGPKYRNLTNMLFGNELEPDPLLGTTEVTPELLEQQPALRQIVEQRRAYDEAIQRDLSTIEIHECVMNEAA